MTLPAVRQAVLQAAGALLNPTNSAVCGTFQQQFGLVRDPSQSNNWKIKFTNASLVSKPESAVQPSSQFHAPHSVSLFTKRVSPKFTLTWDHRQNCPIGQPSTKKWFLGPDKYGPCHKSKEKLGEIRSLLVTLPGTLWVQKFFFLYQSIYGLHLVFYNFFCMTHPNRGGHTRKTGFPDFRIRMNRDGSEKKNYLY